MCIVRRATNIGNKNVRQIVRKANMYTNVEVEMTRKTTIAGDIIYAVVVSRLDNGYHYRIWTYDGILKAWKRYKAATA